MIAENIADYISEKGIKQSAIANDLGIKQQTMSDIINGNRNLKADEYIDICDFLEVPYDKFVTRQQSPN